MTTPKQVITELKHKYKNKLKNLKLGEVPSTQIAKLQAKVEVLGELQQRISEVEETGALRTLGDIQKSVDHILTKLDEMK